MSVMRSARYIAIVVVITVSVMNMAGILHLSQERVSPRGSNMGKRATKLQGQRRKIVHEGCKSYTTERRRTEMEEVFGTKNMLGELLDNIFVIDEYKMLYCYVPKSGSTSWLKFWAFAMGKTNATHVEQVAEPDIHRSPAVPHLRSFPFAEQRRRLATYKKYIVVRHPFLRLISAFHDKFQSNNSYYSTEVVPNIIKRFRNNQTPASSTVTFEEFARWVIYDYKNPEMMDVHWKPVKNLCQPCLVDYDLIGKYETMGPDVETVLEEGNVPAEIIFPLKAGKTNATAARTYMSQLDPELVRQLTDVYRDDFDLFDYKPDEF